MVTRRSSLRRLAGAGRELAHFDRERLTTATNLGGGGADVWADRMTMAAVPASAAAAAAAVFCISHNAIVAGRRFGPIRWANNSVIDQTLQK